MTSSTTKTAAHYTVIGWRLNYTIIPLKKIWYSLPHLLVRPWHKHFFSQRSCRYSKQRLYIITIICRIISHYSSPKRSLLCRSFQLPESEYGVHAGLERLNTYLKTPQISWLATVACEEKDTVITFIVYFLNKWQRIHQATLLHKTISNCPKHRTLYCMI